MSFDVGDKVRQSLNKVSHLSLVAFGRHKLFMEFILDLTPSANGSQGKKVFLFSQELKNWYNIEAHWHILCMTIENASSKEILLTYVIFSQTYDENEDHVIDLQDKLKCKFVAMSFSVSFLP